MKPNEMGLLTVLANCDTFDPRYVADAPAMSRVLKAGWAELVDREGSVGRSGKPLQYLRITEEGRKARDAEKDKLLGGGRG